MERGRDAERGSTQERSGTQFKLGFVWLRGQVVAPLGVVQIVARHFGIVLLHLPDEPRTEDFSSLMATIRGRPGARAAISSR